MMLVALIVLGIALAVLILTDGASQIGGLEPEQFAGLASTGALLAVIAAGFWHQFRHRMGDNLRALLIWAGLGLLCVAGYSYRDQAREIASRVVGELRPGTAALGPGGTVTITRRSSGDFSVRAEVNGQAQAFVFDTGASAVVLTAENAAALGIRPAEAEFNVRVSTANGIALTAPILIDSLIIGTITERRVSAMVSRPGALSGNLLGMSFLSRLASFEVRGDKLILRGTP